MLRLPHISNFTDFDALERHGVRVHYLAHPRDLTAYDPRGASRQQEHPRRPRLAERAGLGQALADRVAVQGAQCWASAAATRCSASASPTPTASKANPDSWLGAPARGHHHGADQDHPPHARPPGDPARRGLRDPRGGDRSGRRATALAGGADGALHPDGTRNGSVQGTYLHGLFDAPGVVAALLGPFGRTLAWPDLPSHASWRDEQLDRLAMHLEQHLDLARSPEILRELRP